MTTAAKTNEPINFILRASYSDEPRKRSSRHYKTMTLRKQVITAGLLGALTISTITAAGIAAASPTPAPPLPSTTTQSGDGSNNTPFTAPCSTDPTQDDCTVDSFPSRNLEPWSNEFVPAYQCPADHKYLIKHDHAPFGTHLIDGVEIRGLSPIGVSMTYEWNDQEFRPTGDISYDVALGRTRTGFPYSSATNWSFNTHSYQVVLHCTKNFDHAKRRYIAVP